MLFKVKTTLNGDGLEKLDFTYISDLVQGVVRTIESPNSKNQVFYNVWCWKEILTMANIVMKHFPRIKIEISLETIWFRKSALSIEKARKLIGYEPNFPLEIGYEKYISWYKKFMNH